MEWSNPVKQEAPAEDDEAASETMPHPRANTAAAYVDGKVYIFGGHGGLKYQRVAFNDLWCFDLSTGHWSKCDYANNPCEPRGGHSIFALGRKLYIYGGWNLETQYNDITTYDLDTKEWYDPNIYNETPRWNFCACMVEAIPSWKYFVFGGEQGDFPEGGPRRFGAFVNTS